MNGTIACQECGKKNAASRYFCEKCGNFLQKETIQNKSVYEIPEMKIARILENLKLTPHNKIVWSDTVDLYTKKVEKFQALMDLPELKEMETANLKEKMMDFLELCYKPDFQIAFVGTIKTGKSTLINSLLGHNYASMAVTPETAALTKFRSSPRDYVEITFYNKQEWKELWASRTSAADAFMKEYKELGAEKQKKQWVGHEAIYKELANSAIESELAIWSSSKRAEHYFVKEIEVGISSLPKDFPKQVVFVDTPGLSDPVGYRSDITKQYIRKANAVFVCVDAQKVQKEEIETISSVFSFSFHNKSKVHIIATHWDKLNKPVTDWEEQKKWFEKRIVGKGFFDTVEMARTNVTYAAAHIFNLCRDYESLEEEDRITLMQFALGMKLNPLELQEHLPELKKLTNIEYIRNIVTEELAKKYQVLLSEDIEKKYWDIIYMVKRIAEEKRGETAKIIELSKASLQEMRKEIADQKMNYEEIAKCKEQLAKALKTVEKQTKKRMDSILPYLTSVVENEK